MSSTASRAHYERIKSPNGRKLREFFDGALTDGDRLPGKRALQAEAEELAAEIPGVDAAALVKQFTAYAHRAQRQADGTLNRFDLRGEVLQLTSALVERLDKADRVVPVEEATPEDITAATGKATESATPWWDEQQKKATAALDAEENRMRSARRYSS